MARSLRLRKRIFGLGKQARHGNQDHTTHSPRTAGRYLFLEGCENVDIARQLGIAHRTVKACFNRLYLRFGITSGIKRVKLATVVYRNQLSSDAILPESNKDLDGNSLHRCRLSSVQVVVDDLNKEKTSLTR